MKTVRFFLWMTIALGVLNFSALAQSAAAADHAAPAASDKSSDDRTSEQQKTPDQDAGDDSPRSTRSASVRNHATQPKRIVPQPATAETAHEKAARAEKQRSASTPTMPEPRTELPANVIEHPAASSRPAATATRTYDRQHGTSEMKSALDGHEFASPRTPGGRMVNSGGPATAHVTEGLNGSSIKPRR
jgi:hypothetical protein